MEKKKKQLSFEVFCICGRRLATVVGDVKFKGGCRVTTLAPICRHWKDLGGRKERG